MNLISCLEYLTSSFVTTQRKLSAFKGLIINQAHWIISPYFKVNWFEFLITAAKFFFASVPISVWLKNWKGCRYQNSWGTSASIKVRRNKTGWPRWSLSFLQILILWSSDSFACSMDSTTKTDLKIHLFPIAIILFLLCWTNQIFYEFVPFPVCSYQTGLDKMHCWTSDSVTLTAFHCLRSYLWSCAIVCPQTISLCHCQCQL